MDGVRDEREMSKVHPFTVFALCKYTKTENILAVEKV